jgi:hypothetical protein
MKNISIHEISQLFMSNFKEKYMEQIDSDAQIKNNDLLELMHTQFIQ